MDRHIRWLRRFLMWRVAKQLGVEGAIVGVLTALGLVLAGVGATTVLLASGAAAQMFGLWRLAFSMVSGPADVRYLMAWEDSSSELVEQPTATASDAQANRMDAVGFRFLTALARTDAGTGTPTANDLSLLDPCFELYTVNSALVLLCASTDEPTVALSRLSNGALLLTTSEVVPPSHRLLVNVIDTTGTAEDESAPPAALLKAHRRTLGRLQAEGLEILQTGSDVVADYLRFEWEAWDEVGPYLGSLLRVSGRGRSPALDVGLPADQILDRMIRSMHTSRPAPTQPPPRLASSAPPPAPAQPSPVQPSGTQRPAAPVAAPATTPESPAPVETPATAPALAPAKQPPSAPPAWTTRTRRPNQSVGADR